MEAVGRSLTDAVRKMLRMPNVDERAIKELVKDLQRTLLQADVNVELVLQLSKAVEERSIKEKDRKSTRLNSSHVAISYAVFCLNDIAISKISTLSLHDALPIYGSRRAIPHRCGPENAPDAQCRRAGDQGAGEGSPENALTSRR